MTKRPSTSSLAVSAVAATPWWRRGSAWLAVLLLAICLGMVAFTLASVVMPGFELLPDRPDPIQVIVVLCTFVTLPSVGAVLAILRPRNPIGWLFLIASIGFTMSVFSTEYVTRSTILGAGLPGYALVDWIGAWSGTVSLWAAIVFIPIVFPDGHPLGPRWRVVSWAALIAFGLTIVAQVVQPTGPTGPSGPTGYAGRLPNPIAVGGSLADIANTVAGLPFLLVFGALAFASIGLRFRRSKGIERQQLKWFLFAVAFLVVTATIGAATGSEWVWYLLILGLSFLPIAAALAVLRYRLYEIDRIISRTLAYAVVSVTLAIVFLGGVLGLTAVLERFTGGNTIAVAASTLVVAALFQPLRSRIQRVVDRRFDRARYDGERTLAAFSARLRDQVELQNLEAELDAVVRQTVAPSSLGLWIIRQEAHE